MAKKIARTKQGSKYKNIAITNDYGRFDSIKEWKRYMLLLDMQRRGQISDLRRQVSFELIPSQRDGGKVVERACCYVADFVYCQDGKQVVEDTKSAITRRNAVYILKRKMMLFFHHVRIKEV